MRGFLFGQLLLVSMFAVVGVFDPGIAGQLIRAALELAIN